MNGIPEIGQALGAVVAPNGLMVTDPRKVDANLRAMLGEMNIDPDAAFQVANGIMVGSVQSGDSPEEAVVGAFVTGLAVGAYLRGKP